ncbi:MAG: hypothetical protein RBT80_04265 [Candidatus Vecturithrix sp.]|jgi:CheY-like chemotaxis protein|nr:hypothetical protein [Candidatus Vecturithrix sp.]
MRYVESTEEALQIYAEWLQYGKRAWLVLSDQVLPGMSGDTLLAKIDQHIIKVLLTGQAGLQSTIKQPGTKRTRTVLQKYLHAYNLSAEANYGSI